MGSEDLDLPWGLIHLQPTQPVLPTATQSGEEQRGQQGTENQREREKMK